MGSGLQPTTDQLLAGELLDLRAADVLRVEQASPSLCRPTIIRKELNVITEPDDLTEKIRIDVLRGELQCGYEFVQRVTGLFFVVQERQKRLDLLSECPG
jgi:hypothetical protein